MSKTTTARAGDIYETARENPYVQRLIEDEELRDSLKDAFESRQERLRPGDRQRQGHGQGRDQRQEGPEGPAQGRREPAGSFREPALKPKRKGGIGKLLLIAIVGAVIALAVSEGARKAVLDALFGAEEEFEYTSTTSINGS